MLALREVLHNFSKIIKGNVHVESRCMLNNLVSRCLPSFWVLLHLEFCCLWSPRIKDGQQCQHIFTWKWTQSIFELIFFFFFFLLWTFLLSLLKNVSCYCYFLKKLSIISFDFANATTIVIYDTCNNKWQIEKNKILVMML